jgi:hypothetical protein
MTSQEPGGREEPIGVLLFPQVYQIWKDQQEQRLLMGADAPIPPVMISAAAVQDFLMKIFSTAFG